MDALTNMTIALAPAPFSPEVPSQFGPSSTDPGGYYFYVCLAAAMILVILFCGKQFGEFALKESNDDYVGQLLPRYLATQKEFSRGLLVYVGAMVFAVFLLSFLNTDTLRSMGVPIPEKMKISAVPLVIAFLLVGILPNVPLLQEIERWLRRYAHERACIPASARAMADRLAAADFDFSSYERRDVLQCAEMRGVDLADFAMPRKSLEYNWARLSCLAYELDRRRTSGDLEALDRELLRRYARHLDSIGAQRKLFESAVAAYRVEKSNYPAYTDYALHRSIQNTLYRLYVLLGCAVRLKVKPDSDMNLALQPFGFKLSQAAVQPEYRHRIVGAMAIVATTVLAFGYVAFGLNNVLEWLGVPSGSVFFPKTWFQPLDDMASTLAIFVPAIALADLIRSYAVDKDRWFTAAGSVPQRPGMTTYLAAAVACGAAGYVSSIIWGLAFAPITADALKLAAPFAVVAAVTGGFWIHHLDNVTCERRPSRLREIGWQSLATGISGLIAAAASFTILNPAAVPVALDRILLTALTSAAIGGLLGWYIPAVVTAELDPLAEVRRERVRSLEAAAFDRFGDATVVARWMEEPHSALGAKSPRSAAADVGGFENAMNLLHGPFALAA